MGKIEVIDKKTKEVLYCYQSVGNPDKPSEIHESGTKLIEFKKKMSDWYESIVPKSEDDDGFELALHLSDGYSDQIANMIGHVMDEETMEFVPSGWEEDLKKYPRPERKEEQHGAAFGFARF